MAETTDGREQRSMLMLASVMLMVVEVFLVPCGAVFGRPFNSRQAESRLIQRLLTDYDPQIRPLKDSTTLVTVNLTFAPVRIDDLDLRSEVFKLTGWVGMVWRDEYIQWDPSTEGNVQCLFLDHEEVWVPPINVINSKKGMFVSHERTYFSKVRVCSTGMANYLLLDNFVLSCAVNIYYFPFDSQTCSIQLLSWYHPDTELSLRAQDRHVDQEHYQEDGEWELLATSVTTTPYNSTLHPLYDIRARFSLVTFSMTLSRRPTYYVVNVLLPCLMLCVLVLSGFFLPPDSGEKVSLGITVLLAFTVFQLLIAEVMPATAVSTPRLAVFLICIMATSTLSIVVSVLVLNLHYRAVCRQPPSWLRHLVLGPLARLVCMQNCHFTANVQPISSGDDEVTPPFATPTERPPTTAPPNIRLTVSGGLGEDGLEVKYPRNAVSDQRMSVPYSRKGDSLSSPLLLKQHVSATDGDRRLEGADDSASPTTGARSRECHQSGKGLNPIPTSLNNLMPVVSKCAWRLMDSMQRLKQQATSGGRPTDGPEEGRQCQQQFVQAVREVYEELHSTRQAGELEQATHTEWMLMARVVDRLFFWLTFACLVLGAAVIFSLGQ